MERLAITFSFILLLCANGKAQFAVIDVKNIATGIRTYNEVRSQAQQMIFNAMAIKNLPQQYRQTIMGQWANLNPANACASCGGWSTAANGGALPGPDYGGAVTMVMNPNQVMSLMTPQAQASFQAHMANSLYLPRAAADADLTVLGQVRGNDLQMQQYVDACRQNAVDPNLISQVQTTQAGSACAAVLAQQNTNTNVLLGRLVEDASIRKAQKIDAATEIVNTEVSHARAFQDTQRQTTGIDQAVRDMYRNLVR